MAPSRRLRALLARNRVVLAVSWLADGAGLRCTAGNAEIARQAGLPLNAAVRQLHVLERDGALATLRPGRAARRRTIVLMDHPDAETAVRNLCRDGYRPGPHTEEAWRAARLLA
jgi:hypothetical protein